MTDNEVSSRTVSAGWYDDGTGTNTTRWWDGSQWTAKIAPATASASAKPSREEVAAGKKERSQLAKQARARQAEVKAQARNAKEEAKHNAKLNKHFAENHKEWQALFDKVQRSLAAAESFKPSESAPVLLKKGELFYATVRAELIEDRAAPRQFVAGHSGVSIPIGTINHHAVRFNTGRTKGHVVQGPPIATAIDSGEVDITNLRIIFRGIKQTREHLFDKMIACENENGNSAVISVSNRQKATRLQFTGVHSENFWLYEGLAQADFQGSRDALVSQLRSLLQSVQEREPKLL